MYETISPSQEKKFHDMSGKEYVAHHLNEVDLSFLVAGTFITEYPYNNKDWDLSPWRFTFVMDKKTGNLNPPRTACRAIGPIPHRTDALGTRAPRRDIAGVPRWPTGTGILQG